MFHLDSSKALFTLKLVFQSFMFRLRHIIYQVFQHKHLSSVSKVYIWQHFLWNGVQINDCRDSKQNISWNRKWRLHRVLLASYVGHAAWGCVLREQSSASQTCTREQLLVGQFCTKGCLLTELKWIRISIMSISFTGKMQILYWKVKEKHLL